MRFYDWACDRFVDVLVWVFSPLNFLAKRFPGLFKDDQQQESPSLLAVFFREAMHGLCLPGPLVEWLFVIIGLIVLLPIFYVLLSWRYGFALLSGIGDFFFFLICAILALCALAAISNAICMVVKCFKTRQSCRAQESRSTVDRLFDFIMSIF